MPQPSGRKSTLRSAGSTTVRGLVCGLALMAAAAALGQGSPGAPTGPPPPPPGPGAPGQDSQGPTGDHRGHRPPFDPNAADALLRLQDDQIRIENRLSELQDQVLSSMGDSGQTKPGDPRLQEIRRLHQKLVLLRLQAANLARQLPPPGMIPPEEARQLEVQRQQIHDQMVKIRDGMDKLRSAAKSGSDPVPEGQDPNAPPPPPKQALPTTPSAAGEAVHRGDVHTPRNLIETFMQIPDKEIPKSNLDAYRRKPHQ